jgi:hypothetical protein
MNEFYENLKRDIANNPLVAAGIGAALLTATSKLITSVASVRSRAAYAEMMKNAAKKAAK